MPSVKFVMLDFQIIQCLNNIICKTNVFQSTTRNLLVHNGFTNYCSIVTSLFFTSLCFTHNTPLVANYRYLKEPAT